MNRTTLILFLVVCCQTVYAQDTIQPRWSYEVPGKIRHTSVRGQQIGIAVDSTVFVIDRSTGQEQRRVATHHGVIEGIGLMPGDTTFVIVAASYDSVSRVVVNTVVEVDVRTGAELRQMFLPPVPAQIWMPDTVQTVCAFSHDGNYVYTSTPQFLNGVPNLLEHGNYHRIDLATFTDMTLERTTGPHGTIEISKDDRIVSFWGSYGSLVSNPRFPTWSGGSGGVARIGGLTNATWKMFGTRIRIAPHGRFFHDARYLYDTSSLAPSRSPELLGTIDLDGMCHNGKHYYSQPAITIRELGTNKVVRDLAYNTPDTTLQWWLEINDSLFTIAQERHVTCWPFALESEFPARIVHTLPDTITKNTCIPVSLKPLPLGVPMQITASTTNGSLRYGAVQFTQEGEQSVTLDLVIDGVVQQTDSHRVVVTPLQLHAKAFWGMKIPEAITDVRHSMPRFSADGRHVVFASTQWLVQGSLDDSAMHSIRYDSAHALLGALVAPSGDAYTLRDSVGRTNKTLRTDVLRPSGDTGVVSMHHYTTDSYMLERYCRSNWDATYGWVVTVLTRNPSGVVDTETLYDATTGNMVSLVDETQHRSRCFDRDPVTNKLWWIGRERGAVGEWSEFYAYRMNADASIDSMAFNEATRSLFVAGGTYLLIDNKLYDRQWQWVGPDTTLPSFKDHTFLGRQPYALDVTRPTSTGPCHLRIRRLPGGEYIDSVLFDVQVEGIDATQDGRSIALTFHDGSLQVFATESLFADVTLHVESPILQRGGLVIAPHPVMEGAMITIERWNASPLDYIISDLHGVEVARGQVPETSNAMWWDRRDNAAQRLSSGMYAISITDGVAVRRSLIILE